jgi:hypothetical protein
MRRISRKTRASFGAMASILFWAPGGLSHFATAHAAEMPRVPLVGKDKEGRSKAIFVPGEQYLEKMSSTLFSVNQSVLPQLNQRTCGKEEHEHYELTTVIVALGIEFQVGLGALFSVTTGGKMELVYANQNDPVIPE